MRRIATWFRACCDASNLKYGLPPAVAAFPLVVFYREIQQGRPPDPGGFDWAVIIVAVMAFVTIGTVVWKSGRAGGERIAEYKWQFQRIADLEEEIQSIYRRLEEIAQNEEVRHAGVQASLSRIDRAVSALIAVNKDIPADRARMLAEDGE